jgi:hypothetical protein
MQPATKKLGEMLVEAQLITVDQLQDALRQQRIAGGRMGSNLVAMGFISEDVLMDFLAQKTGVPRLDLRALNIPAAVLQRIPRRLAEQLMVLPISLKEPKSLVVAMADPSDLNAVDSARFASGLNIEPVVASYSALKLAIPEYYRKVAGPEARTIDVGASPNLDEGLPVNFDLTPAMLEFQTSAPPSQAPPPAHPASAGAYGHDPFFSLSPTPSDSPFNFFGAERPQSAPPEPLAPPSGGSQIIHARSTGSPDVRRIESFETRTIVLGLIRLLQRRGVIGEDELQRFLTNLVESGELEERGQRG